MKIVIIGAGITGLSTYLFLKKHLLCLPDQHHEVKIYEAYDISKYIGKSCAPTISTTATSNRHTNVSAGTNHKAATRNPKDSDAGTVLEEPSFTPEAIASAIGISRNGLNVLARLFSHDESEGQGFSSILADMLKEGHAANKWQMSNSRGWKLVDVDMGLEEKGQNDVSKSANASGKHEGLWKDSPVNLIMISRQAFWSILLKHVVAKDGSEVVQHKKVVELVIPSRDSAEKTIVKFADASEEAADLVIGADGLRSVVRKAMFQPQPPSVSPSAQVPQQGKAGFLSWLPSFLKPSDSKTDKDYITPHYEGLVGVGSFIPSSILSTTNVPPGVMSVVFGPNGFFGHGYITSAPPIPALTSPAPPNPGAIAVFWSTFASKSENPFPLPSHTNGEKRAKPHEFDRSAALKAMIARHQNWKNPTIQAILKYVEEKSGIDGFWPTWTTPELPTWSKSGTVVLVGDAAHALQPSSGQGACQGLEDAEGLALLLRHYLGGSRGTGLVDENKPNGRDSERKAVAIALEKFDKLRLPRLRRIYERSQKMSGMKSDMGFVTEMIMYAAIKVMMLLHDGYQDELVGYDLPADVERIVKDG